MRESIYRNITKFIMKTWPVLLIACGLLTALTYPKTQWLFSNISTDLIKLLPSDYKSVQELEKIRTRFKGGGALSLVFESENPEKTKKFIADLAEILRKDPKVSEVSYKKPDYSFFDKHKLLFLDLDDLETIRDRIDRRIQKEKLGDLYIDFEEDENDKDFKFGDLESKYKSRYGSSARSEFITDDEGKIFTVGVVSSDNDESLGSFERFYDHIKAKLDSMDLAKYDPSLKVYYAGTVKTRIDEYKTLISDLKLAGIISGLGIFLLLAIYFRRPVSTALIFLPLGAGIVYSFAFATIFIKNLNVVTSFLFAVLGGLGVEVGIHMFARYLEERSKGVSVEDSVFVILHNTGRAAITSGLTLAATFLVLIVNDFKGFSEFGLITGSGILIVYATYHVLFPPLLIFAEKIRLLRFKEPESFEEEANGPELKFPYAKQVIYATAALFIISLFGLFFAKFEYNFGNLKSNIKQSQIAKEKLRKTMASVNRPAMVLIKDLDDALAVKSVIKEKIKADEDAKVEPVLDVYKSWYDIVQYNQPDKMKVIGEMKTLLADNTLKIVKGEHKKDLDRFKEALNETTPIKESEVPKSAHDLFWGNVPTTDGLQVSYINPNPKMELDDGRNAMALYDRVSELKTERGTFYAASDALIFAKVLKTMLSDVPRVVLLSLAMVLLFVFLDLRDYKKTLLIVSPILLGVVIMFGFMFVFGLKLNFYNMIVIPTVFGTSIDNSIHIYHRFEEMGSKSLMKVLKTSGGAALMSSLTNIFGFLGLVFANHRGLSSIGVLAIAGMMACLFTTLIYFPAALEWLISRKHEKEVA